MAPQYSEEELIEAYEVYKAAGSFRKAAEELGIDKNTVSKRVRKFEEARGAQDTEDTYEIPDLPTEEVPTEELIDRMTEGLSVANELKKPGDGSMLRLTLTNLLGLLFWVTLILMTLVAIGLPYAIILTLLRILAACEAARSGTKSITGLEDFLGFMRSKKQQPHKDGS